LRLLIIEDNQRLCQAVAQSLRAQGFAVDTAASASEGLRVWRGADYDAAVLDLMLPDGTGLNALKEMRDRGNTTPVLILTALGTIEDRVRGLDCCCVVRARHWVAR
jgi:DNA-binding response OmpR family regulator